jgi:hypothetical protein
MRRFVLRDDSLLQFQSIELGSPVFTVPVCCQGPNLVEQMFEVTKIM